MSTTTLANLKLTTARKPRALPSVVQRRNKLLKKLHEQRDLAVANVEGRTYAPKRLRTVRDMEGSRVVREVAVRIKPWSWTGEKGETLLCVYYGSKMLELGKGKTAIEFANTKDLVQTLDVVIMAVQNGELDVQIESASSKLREGFKR